MHKKTFTGVLSALIISSFILGAMGCGKKDAKQVDAFEDEVNKIVSKIDAAQKPYTGKLTPEKAALITHEVSMQSMAAFPVDKEMSKDPKALSALNEKIREKNEAIYKKHGTSMNEVTRFISGLSPKNREKYNEKLTELFLEQSKKKYDKQQSKEAPAKEGEKPAESKAEPVKPEAKKDTKKIKKK